MRYFIKFENINDNMLSSYVKCIVKDMRKIAKPVQCNMTKPK